MTVSPRKSIIIYDADIIVRIHSTIFYFASFLKKVAKTN